MSESILVIDDSSEIHQLLEVRLRPEVVTLHHAYDAEDGLRQVAILNPDLVLLDIDLPGLTGFEVCQRLKANPQTASVPVIFLTGASDVWTKVQGFDLGATDYVTKPFEAAELRARVRSTLRTKRLQDLLALRAQVDGLTNLWNRAYFDQRLDQEIAACRRYGRSLSLLLADLDHFKRLNDSFGHPFGDRVLEHFGAIVARSVRATDAACRYGGEEFAIVLPETDVDAALVVAGRIQKALSEYLPQPRGELVRVTASLGLASVAMLPSARLCPAELIQLADDALYQAKQTGRNRVCVASPRV